MLRSSPRHGADFTVKHNLPADHNFHTHTYFTTYKVHLRAADRWMNLLERGHMKSLDNAEFGRWPPATGILMRFWLGSGFRRFLINAPGRYEDYAANPWKYSKAVIDKVQAGTYEHFYPPVQTGGTGR